MNLLRPWLFPWCLPQGKDFFPALARPVPPVDPVPHRKFTRRIVGCLT